jgi:hypothetical protein
MLLFWLILFQINNTILNSLERRLLISPLNYLPRNGVLNPGTYHFDAISFKTNRTLFNATSNIVKGIAIDEEHEIIATRVSHSENLFDMIYLHSSNQKAYLLKNRITSRGSIDFFEAEVLTDLSFF